MNRDPSVGSNRRHSGRIGRVICGLTIVVVVMAAVPAVASAQVVLNGALLNPSVSAPPGSVVGSTRLVVTIPTGGTTPTYISYSLGGTPGSSPCLLLSRASGFDSSGHIAYGTTVNRDLGPLPRAPGNVHVNIRAWTSSSCTGASGSNVETVLDVVTAPVTNPRLPARCGLRVILVLDESGSIVAPPGRPDLGNQTATVQKAARGFVEALTGTGSRLAIIAFSRRSRDGVSYRTVTRGAADVFKSWIGENGHAGASVDGNAGYHPQNRTENNGTNWQSPLERVQEMNETDGKADLVMFVTDGDPNFHNGIAVTGSALTDGAAAAMIPAWKAANTVKGNGAGTGSKVFAIGVGPALETTASKARLTAISGDAEYTGDNFSEADFATTAFDDLAQKMEDFVTQQCAPSVNITKVVETPDGQEISGQAGWQFDGNLSVHEGENPSHTWIDPDKKSQNPVTQFTDEGGIAAFKWETHPANANSTLHVTAHDMDGYSLDTTRSECTIHPTGKKVPIHALQFDVPVSAEQFATCEVFNVEHVPDAHLIVRKLLDPPSDEGRFDLVVNRTTWFTAAGHDQETVAIPVPPGTTATVRERVNASLKPDITLDQYSISIDCVTAQGGAVAADETGRATWTVPVETPGETVTCTITNARKPGEPEEPLPPPPPPLPPPPTDPCGAFPLHPGCAADDPPPMVQATSLAIHKTMPAHAHVGHRVPITITVTNSGQHTAIDVTLTETPPGGGRIVHAANHGSIRHDGTVLWHLGNLAPGETRTVHATMLVTAPGRHLNAAVADASNADVVRSNAAVRAPLGAAPAPPPPIVTG